MTMDSLLRMLLVTADAANRNFDRAATAAWPPGSLDELQRLGILRRSAGGLYATCPNCGERHTEPVCAVGDCLYLSCPEALLVEVQPEACESWEIDPGGLAAWVAGLAGLKGKPREVVAGRLWRLGRTPWPPGSDRTRGVVFARRMQEDAAASVAAHVGPAGRAVVVVPHHVPDERVWSGTVPAVIPLSQVVTWSDGGPVLDVMAMLETIEAADALAERARAVSLDARGQKAVRRQVKAEIKSLLPDDAMVAAYKEHGSYRKAAKALTQQTGQSISKDKVRRAVERRGGIPEVLSGEDSASVARTVASQRRDRATKISQRR